MGLVVETARIVFLQHVLCKTFTFEVFWGASKHPSEATFLNASQSKPLLLSRVMKIAELSLAKAPEQRFCMEGSTFLHVVSKKHSVGSPGALGPPWAAWASFGTHPPCGLSGALEPSGAVLGLSESPASPGQPQTAPYSPWTASDNPREPLTVPDTTRQP